MPSPFQILTTGSPLSERISWPSGLTVIIDPLSKSKEVAKVPLLLQTSISFLSEEMEKILFPSELKFISEPSEVLNVCRNLPSWLQSLITPSSLFVNICPLAPKFTTSSIIASCSRMFSNVPLRFQSFTVLPRPTKARIWLSGLKRTSKTGTSLLRVLNRLPSRFQSTTEPLILAPAINWPSGLKLIPTNKLLISWNVVTRFFSGFQSLIVLSKLIIPIVFSLGLKWNLMEL